MNYLSTRGQTPPTSLDDAITAGLAPDGGLFVPEALPSVALQQPADSLADTATAVLAPFFAGSALNQALPDLCAEAFNFPAPLTKLHGDNDYLLELFHGLTAAFKDYAARFLAGCMAALRQPNDPVTTILVATSGDTGAAVGSAFHQREGFRVVILYPHGLVSPRQAHGLECFGGNVQAYRVDGTFDDCQKLVKQALVDESLRAAHRLGSANSISLGRLLPQMAYYAHTALGFHAQHGERLNFIIPTGNLGNGLACWMAKQIGLPIGDIQLACNANDTVACFLGGEAYTPKPSVPTLANAMDVGAPSNMERLRWWLDDDAVRQQLSGISVDDLTIRSTVRAAPAQHGQVICPHTACGVHLLEQLRQSGDKRPWAVAATAHPAKFDEVVERLIQRRVPLPKPLAQALSRPTQAAWMRPEMGALAAILTS